MTWQLRDPWCLGYLGLAVLLGVGIGTSGAAWLSTVTVLAAMVLGVLRPAASMVWAAALVLLVLTATVLGVITGERAVESAALASSSALAHAAAIALPVGLVALVRRTRRHRRQGWELASAIAATESARAESALVRERSVMAGEIHDHLGHRLTLLTVQVGRLTLDPDLPESTRAALAEVRGGLAEAASELGATVQLLGQGSMPTRAPADRSPAEVVERARSAGVRVEGDLPPRWEEELSAPARSAAVRVLSEGLANAAKHAPGQAVHLAASSDDGVATLELATGRADQAGGEQGRAAHGGVVQGRVAQDGPTAPSPAPSSGHGLRTLRHRVSLLGGDLAVEEAEQFVLRVSLPVDAAPGPDSRSRDGVQEVLRSQRAADADTRRTRRRAWLVPAALAGGAVVLTAGFFLYLSVASTLSPEDFARIEVGMPQTQAEQLLPPVQMVEAPRDTLPEPAGASCRYHEEAVSLFVREDVFRVCLADGVVVSTDTIPGEGP